MNGDKQSLISAYGREPIAPFRYFARQFSSLASADRPKNRTRPNWQTPQTVLHRSKFNALRHEPSGSHSGMLRAKAHANARALIAMQQSKLHGEAYQ
jgi:uncharacterized protein (DUF1800 family)